MESDTELLARFGRGRAEDAFAELLHRHLGLVYSAALRQVRSPHLAQDVAQTTFVKLANHAHRLAADTVLSAWLYEVSRREAIDVIRREIRRGQRETIFAEMNATNHASSAWAQIEPLLDEALQVLDKTDRAAILLRYFENKSLREIGATLAMTDNAAQKRIARAVEQMRAFFAKRGVLVGATALVSAVSAHAVQPPPIALASTILSRVALAPASRVPNTATTTVRILAMTTLQKVALSVCVLGLVWTATHSSLRPLQPSMSGDGPRTALDKNQTGGLAAARRSSRGSFSESERLARRIADLRDALHLAPARSGTRRIPSAEVVLAMDNFGPNRQAAFLVLQAAVAEADLEVRRQAVAALWLVGKSSSPEVPFVGEAVPEVKPLLMAVLQSLNHDDPHSEALVSLRNMGLTPADIPDLTRLLSATAEPSLQRYLPQAIAQAIAATPVADPQLVAPIQALLASPDPNLRFAAACALAAREVPGNPQFLDNLAAGLSLNSGQQLMALETLASLGSAAKPAVPAILDYSGATIDTELQKIAMETIAGINPDLRTDLPAVDQAIKSREAAVNWQDKLASGTAAYGDLVAALQDPTAAGTAAQHLGELGAAATAAVPQLISALAGQDQGNRALILEAINQIDPNTVIPKVDRQAFLTAVIAATSTLDGLPGDQQRSGLVNLMNQANRGGIDWYTQLEVQDLARQLAAANQGVYLAFVGTLTELQPGLAKLFPAKSKP